MPKYSHAGDLHDPKPYKFIRFGDLHGPKPYKFTRSGDLHGPKRVWRKDAGEIFAFNKEKLSGVGGETNIDK